MPARFISTLKSARQATAARFEFQVSAVSRATAPKTGADCVAA